MAVPSDAELATQALAGSQEACRELVARYANPAVNLAARLVHNQALAEDLAQEAFIRAFRRLDSYDPARKFSSWLFQVVHNVAVDHLRRKRVQTVSLDDSTSGDQFALAARSTDPSPAADAEREALGRAIAAALERIRPEYREALVLHYQEGLTHAEVGAAIGAPLGTVKTYLHRGRAELASLLSEQGWGPSPDEASKPSPGNFRRVSRD